MTNVLHAAVPHRLDEVFADFDRSALDGANVVDATDDRIVDIDPIQEAIRQVIDPEIKVDARTFVGKVEVSRREYAEVADALQSLPWFDRFDSDYPSGYYIRAGDVLTNVTLTPFCRESYLFDASDTAHSRSDCVRRQLPE